MLKLSAAGTFVAGFPAFSLAKPHSPRIGIALQLYSVRQAMAVKLEAMAKNLENTLAVDRSQLPKFDVVGGGTSRDADNSGRTDSTKAIQAAIDACAKNGPGRVIFPAGVYRFGTIILKSGVHLEFKEGASVFASTDPADYPSIRPKYTSNTYFQVDKSLIYAENVENISITGPATFDFGGCDSVYDKFGGNNDTRRPFGIRIVSSKNIYIQGLRLYNSPMWMQHYHDCENVMIENIYVFNHAQRNNDGLDLDGVRNGYVRNCTIDSDDDAFCLKGNGPSSCENILIENCVGASHCNVLKLGTETTGGFKNILYRNIKVIQSATGWRHINGVGNARTAITMIITDGGRMENVWFDNIEATQCVSPIFITLGNRNLKWNPDYPEPGIGSIENIVISNMKATCAGPIPSSITGLGEGHLLKNIVLENISLSVERPAKENSAFDEQKFVKFKSGYPSPHFYSDIPGAGLYCRYVEGLTFDNVKFLIIDKDPREGLIIEKCTEVVKQNVTFEKLESKC